ncbi:CMP-KDO synthetase-like protein [Leptospira ellinghausenii]|uniref:CMP-KDO synthetase-like protein n=1 Tax=Leptospira ellinghausenii TaxID=1917822 RepID=A0A2P2DF48_9LEPT|nr:spore coat biosynthesis protein F [Leptospira ellinghausenii]GBF43257.1 CMP-KDO synthetase-like protein [Leptospira ellinghausenii]
MSGIHSTHDSFAFIQARLGSTRFPKKILKSIPEDSGVTFLDHIHRRLSTVFAHDQIIFLIPESDDESIQFLNSRGYHYFCGSELDVRDRFRKAAKHYGAKHIFRLTADNPFVDINSIRYLYEAILEIKDTYYSLSMSGLPLGMGVECFSTASLCYDTEDTQLERHKEHVSLHIKEFPEIHKQYRLSPPHLQPLDIFRRLQNGEISNLRITVDEKKDFEMICQIWNHLGETNPFFGAEEVLQLYDSNPNFFQLNANVEQVVFTLPKTEKIKKRVNVLYGNPLQFGYGHFERCKSLSIYLQLNGYDVQLIDSFIEEESNIPYIFDTREIEYPVQNAFYIDNLNHPPNTTDTTFFLPHPSIPSSNENSLSYYSSPLSELISTIPESSGKLLVYAGQLNETESTQIDEYVLKFHQSKNQEIPRFHTIIRIGGKKPNDSNINYQPRISYSEFLREIDSSEWICTYFGQTMIEGMAKFKKVCLIGISEIHETLGLFAEKELGVPYIGSLSKLNQIDHFPNKTDSKKINLVRDAHTKILSWLNSID